MSVRRMGESGLVIRLAHAQCLVIIEEGNRAVLVSCAVCLQMVLTGIKVALFPYEEKFITLHTCT